MARDERQGRPGRARSTRGPASRSMYALFSRYYEQVSSERFDDDLGGKDYVILLFDGDGADPGLLHDQAPGVAAAAGACTAASSAATPWWPRSSGASACSGSSFLRHLFAQKLQPPFEPYWWMLISKGYKTYLLMANNFAEHYPRYERATPPGEAGDPRRLRRRRCSRTAYDAASGLIDVRALARAAPRRRGADHRRACSTIRASASSTSATRPGPRGTELACIARMTWSMPVYYGAQGAVEAGPARHSARAGSAAAAHRAGAGAGRR